MDIIELFAGVGGFRIGLQNVNPNNKIVWSNQWEPSTKIQHASDIYVKNFGKDGHTNSDIMKIDEKKVPHHDMLCGGFPCFTAGHKILTENGYKNIENIKKGDMVLTHKNRYKEVIIPMKKKSNHIYKLKIKDIDKTLEVTAEHPFYVIDIEHQDKNPKWIEVKDIDKNKHLLLTHTKNKDDFNYKKDSTNKYFDMYEIESIEFKNINIEVYNFEVADDNSYTVENIIVHNCQAYSVARPKNLSLGMDDPTKGVLWWDIHRIISEHNTNYLFLENVDRLLLSPSKQRGKDFAVLLKSLMNLNYVVEWRVINAADYGFPQKRRRTFIFAYKRHSKIFNEIFQENDLKKMIKDDSIFGQTFPIKDFNSNDIKEIELYSDIYEITESFNKENKDKNPFLSSGIAFDNKVYSIKSEVDYNGEYLRIRDILLPEEMIEKEFYVDSPEEIEKWRKVKDKCEIPRTNKKTGISYVYKQGAMAFPEPINSPSRTIITSEGNRTASRTTHIIMVNGRYRRLHPIELERLNGFPDNHTEGVSNVKRGFLMGNALVVGIVEKVAQTIEEIIN